MAEELCPWRNKNCAKSCRYPQPVPREHTDTATGLWLCDSNHRCPAGFQCARPAGHDGDHEAISTREDKAGKKKPCVFARWKNSKKE